MNNIKVKPGYILQKGDNIKVYIDNKDEGDESVKPEKMRINVIYEDDYIIGINKPSGLVVHPGINNEKGTLLNGLVDKFKNLSESYSIIIGENILNRLNKKITSLCVHKDKKIRKTIGLIHMHDILRSNIN